MFIMMQTLMLLIIVMRIMTMCTMRIRMSERSERVSSPNRGLPLRQMCCRQLSI